MPHYFKDGSIASSNIMLFKKSGYWISHFTNYGICKARIEEVLYTDDPRNSTYNTNLKQVQYVCTIMGGINEGQKLFNVSSLVPLGGVYNSGEIIRTANTSEDTSGKSKKPADQTQGEIVLISFLHGSPESPVIIGSLKHPKSTYAAKKTDGQRAVFEINGVVFQVNKDGELLITFGGGIKNSSGTPANQSNAGSKIQFSKSGGVTITDKDGNGIIMDTEAKKITLTSGSGSQLSIEGSVISLGGTGGMQAARINDIVFGTDSSGGPINAYIGMGSATVLIGG